MSALFLPLAAAQGLLLAVAFLNLGTQTVGLAGEPPEVFPVYADNCHAPPSPTAHAKALSGSLPHLAS